MTSRDHETCERCDWCRSSVESLSRMVFYPDFVTTSQTKNRHVCSSLVGSSSICKRSNRRRPVFNYVNVYSIWAVCGDCDVKNKYPVCRWRKDAGRGIICPTFIVNNGGKNQVSGAPITFTFCHSSGESNDHGILRVCKNHDY